jgi:hypothetical protein
MIDNEWGLEKSIVLIPGLSLGPRINEKICLNLMVFTHYTEWDKIVCRCGLAFQLHQARTAPEAGRSQQPRTQAGH